MSEQDIDEQTVSADLLNGFEARMRKTGRDKRTVGWFKTNLESLNTYWIEFYERHRKIAKAADLKESNYFKNDVFSEVENNYNLTKTMILNAIAPGRNQSTLTADEDNSDVVVNVAHRSALQPIQLPKFSGKHLEWETFKEMYLALVHNVASIPPVIKLQYLLGALTGDAANRLKNLQITAKNYSGAWDTLVRRYDNKRVLLAAHMNNIISCPAAKRKSSEEINRILDVMEESKRAFENLGCPVEHWDSWFVHHAVHNLDSSTREEWEKSLDDSADFPSFKDLVKFLEGHVRALDTARVNDTSSKSNTSQGSFKSKNFKAVQSHTSSVESKSNKKMTKTCIVCQGQHFLSGCERYKTMNVAKRLSLINNSKLCSNCLKGNHVSADCRAIGRCYLCQGKHHTSLHSNSSKDEGQSNLPMQTHDCNQTDGSFSQQSSSPASRFAATSHTVSVTQGVMLATAVVELQNDQGDSVTARALLDQGAECSFITERVAQCLSLPRTKVSIPILGIGTVSPGTARSLVSVTLKSPINPRFQMKMNALVLKKLTALLPSKKTDSFSWDYIRDLQLADPAFGTPANIDCIIGADLYGMLLTGNVRKGAAACPTAQETEFGWVLSGPTQPFSILSNVASLRIHTTVTSQDLQETLRAFWEVEDIPVRLPRTPEDEQCENHFNSTYKRNDQGRFVVRLPLKENDPKLGDSKSIAISRWLQTENRLQRDPVLLQLYNDFMREYLQLGHMEEVLDAVDNSELTYYLPHHGVLKSQGSSRKIRVVFNASQKSSNGQSLNDYLMPGPKLQEDLWIVLTRWRFFATVFTSDIVKMFRQVLIDRRDADFQRIIWRENPTQNLRVFRLLTVTYGTTTAPFLASRTLLELADLYKDKYPAAAQMIKENRYVDDFLGGADTAGEAQVLRTELINLLNEAGFALSKWSSNDLKLLPELCQEERLMQTSDQDETVSTLGIVWLPKDDCFRFKLKPHNVKRKISKRTILSDTAKLFDPLGWCGPIIIRAKVLMQDLWLAGTGWDDALPSTLEARWSSFVTELNDIESIRIPRWTGATSSSRLELHGFSDASERAYAACIYLVVREDEHSTSTLILAKTKVSPIKTLSIPRLELCGSHLLAKLMSEFLAATPGKEYSIYCWTDAKIVLSWLSAHPSKWTTFVATRVSSILTLLPGVKWNHVRTQDNPADIASRGTTLSELRNSKLWWEGPEWLTRGFYPENSNPTTLLDSVPETRTTMKFVLTTQIQDEDIITRFSSFQKLVRVISYCLRFYDRTHSKKKDFMPWITSTETQRAKCLIVKLTQEQYFADEINDLKKPRQIQRNSTLLSLRPFLDQEGLLRVGGRLSNAPLSFDEKHPVIIPKSSYLSRLLINHAHLQTLHGGPQLTHSYLVRKFWIIHARSAIHSILRECVRCVRFKAKPQHQLMGSLPSCRVSPGRAFLRSGVDYAGPIQVRTTKGRGHRAYKGYICIFVCMATRAVHIEVASDYSSTTFIAAFKRFVARRGHCMELWSDNGTTFRGADVELKKMLVQACRNEEIATQLENDGTSWKFIPPGAPHFGGLWEAAVKSTKHHMKRVLGESTLTYEELSTLMTEIEACLNSRPLYALSNDPQDLTAFTPGHFLVGSALRAVPEAYNINNAYDKNPIYSWMEIKKMKNDLWRRWKEEYLNSLQQRTKWSRSSINLQVGDLVLIRNENLPPTKWALGRILEIHPGKDGLVRVVSVRTAGSTFTRPIEKICKLPVFQELPSV